MAQGVPFAGANTIYRAPPGREDVRDLHAFTNGNCIVSAWELSDAELDEVIRTRRVFLSSFSGRTLFPVFELNPDYWRYSVSYLRDAETELSVPSLFDLLGLAMHAESWGAVMSCRLSAVPMATWRRHFIGKMPRATRSAELKELAVARCRQLGFVTQRHDQAEAIGILDYACETLGIRPYWQKDEALCAPSVRT